MRAVWGLALSSGRTLVPGGVTIAQCITGHLQRLTGAAALMVSPCGKHSTDTMVSLS